MAEGEIDDLPVDEAASEDDGEAEGGRSWALRYPPLFSILGGLLIAILVMPSALNLPQENPTQTVEFAPVPPEDDQPPAPEGNFDSLGLGSSSGIEGDGAGGGDGPGGDSTTTTLPPPILDGVGENVSDKRCVAGRQTEDPLSPPCVAFFDGDNFGATYQGVTAEEINILLYTDGGIIYNGTSRGAETAPTRTYYDLIADPPKSDDHAIVRMMRGWQQYFNTRYQTYGRTVRFHIFFSGADRSAQSRRADAADNFKRVEPFAVIVDAAFDGGGDAYLDSMLKRGVLNFGSFNGQSARFYQRFPKLLWGFVPSLEIQAQQYADVLCRKYVPHRVDHSPQYMGDERKFGLVYTEDPGYDGLREFKDAVMQRFRECGGKIDPENIATFPKAGYSVDTTSGNSYAVDAMTRFRANGVTTIIWPGGLETRYTTTAGNMAYYPEFIIAGDGQLDAEFTNQTQDQNVMANAVVVSNQPFTPEDVTEQLCFQAYRTIDAQAPRQDVNAIACPFYNKLRQLFIGIQVAGPRLGPSSVDQGFHAIPAVPSNNAQVPACFYLPNDYTCIKDLVIARYDPAARQDTAPACWRFAQAKRYLGTDVPEGNATAQMTPNDPCLGYDTSQQQSIGAPDPGQL